jgi:hypothetical protein
VTSRRIVADAAFGFGPFDTVSPADWVPLTDSQGTRVRQADWTIGRADELEHFPAGTGSVLLRNRDRALDPDNPSSPYAGDLLPLVPVRLRSIGPAQALVLPGAGGATATTSDRSSFTGSTIDVRIGLSTTVWTPGGFGVFFVSQYGGSDIAWSLSAATSGNLQFSYSTNGTAVTSDASTVATGFSSGSDHAIRATFTGNNGAGGRTSTFYTSSDDVTWTQLGAPVTTAGTVTLHDSSLPIAVGDVLPLIGEVRWVEIRVDDVLVANPNFAAQPPGSTEFTDSFGNTWAVNGTAQIAANPDVDVTLDEFYGYVRDGWQLELAPKGANDCRVELVDLLGVVAGYQLSDVFESAVLGLSGVRGFWVLDQADAEKIVDLSSFRRDGSVAGEGITVGERVITPGHPPAAKFDVHFDAVDGEHIFGYVDFGRSPLMTGVVPAFLAVFRARSRGTLNWRTLFVQGNSNAAGQGFQLVIDTSGRLSTTFKGGVLNQARRTTGSVVDNKTHIAWAHSSSGIGLDTATLTSTVGTPGLGSMNGAGIGGGRGIQVDDHMDGWIATVALFSSLPSLANRQIVIDAYTKLNGARSDQQIGWALDQLGVPASMRNLDEGSVLMGPADTKGKDALAWMRLVTATEAGGLYVDHRDGGRIRFTDRYQRFLDPRSTISQATFSDAGTAGTIKYAADGLEVASNGLDGIVNQATVSWVGGEVTVEDSASIGMYGPRQRNVETVASTPSQGRSAGEWLISRYKDPRSRVRGCTASARSTFDRDDRVQALRVDDRVTFEITPGKVGSETSADMFVDGVTHRAQGTVWETAFRFAPVDTFTPWIWGTSEWDVDTHWG